MKAHKSGVALLMVIFILVGVAVIAGPLAFTMLAHEEEGVALMEGSRAGVESSGALNHTVSVLYNAVGSKDLTRRSDLVSEFRVPFAGPGSPAEFLTANGVPDAELIAWGANATDLQSLINLNTLTPQMCRNLLGSNIPELTDYRLNGNDGTYRLMRTVFEARGLGVTEKDIQTLDRFTTVWSGPDTYGGNFTPPIPATVDQTGTDPIILWPGLPDRIAPGLVLRLVTGTPGAYTVTYARILSVVSGGSGSFRLLTSRALPYTSPCLISVEVPRPINVNTASVEVLKALFMNIGLVSGSTLNTTDVDQFVRNILNARQSGRIEGLLEMSRIVLQTFPPGSDKAAAVLRQISYPSPNLYELADYTAPLCYDSDPIFEISSFARVGSASNAEAGREDFRVVVNVAPPAEDSIGFESQYDWQNLIDCGMGVFSVTGPRVCSVRPDSGYIFDVAPDKIEGDPSTGWVSLQPERIFRDKWTTFSAHFDHGTKDNVFDADINSLGSPTATVSGLEVTEDDNSNLDEWGVNFARGGGTLAYNCETNIPWQTSNASLIMEQPLEIEFWVHLADDWSPAAEQVLLEFGDTTPYENKFTIWWKPPSYLTFTIADADLLEDCANYVVPMPDENSYVQWVPGGSYHIRVVCYKTWNNCMAVFVDNKKLKGYFSRNWGVNGVANPTVTAAQLTNGKTCYLIDYELGIPPQVLGGGAGANGTGPGMAQMVTIPGDLFAGKCKLAANVPVCDLGSGFTASIPEDLDPFPTDKIPVKEGTSGFPDRGILIWTYDGNNFIYCTYDGKEDYAFLKPNFSPNLTFSIRTTGGVQTIKVGAPATIPDNGWVQLLNIPVSGNTGDYPDAGFFALPTGTTQAEVFAYMGKMNFAGKQCFILNPFYMGTVGSGSSAVTVYGRALNGSANSTAHGSSQTLIQMFDTDWNLSLNEQGTIIDNNQQKELHTVIAKLGGMTAFETTTSKPYYVLGSNGQRLYSRVLVFPSGELPTVRPDKFYVGTDSLGSRQFKGSIDEIKIIAKSTEGTANKNPEYQPFEIYYGRYSSAAGGDRHLVISDFWTPIVARGQAMAGYTPPSPMWGKCFVLCENNLLQWPGSTTAVNPWDEVVFMTPTDTNPDPPPVTQLKLEKKVYNFISEGIPVASTQGFPERGYILVNGNYLAKSQDRYSGAVSSRMSYFHAVYYYSSCTGTSFTGIQLFTMIDHTYITPGNSNSSTLNVINENQSFIYAALVSTEVTFDKRGALWTTKAPTPQDINPNGAARGDFQEGARMMCLRHPMGSKLKDSISPDGDVVTFDSMPVWMRDTAIGFAFEVGTSARRDLEVLGADNDPDLTDMKQWRLMAHGSFGTTKNTHVDGDVITMLPTRYLDRSVPLSNSPFLHYLAVQQMKGGMRIKAVEWDEQPQRYDKLGVRILMRVDKSAAWETDPGTDVDTLREFKSPPNGKIRINASDGSSNYDYFPANSVEFRIFFEWKSGAYSGDDWKECAQLKFFRMYYEQPTQVLWSTKSIY